MKENNIKIELTPIETEHLTKELQKHFKNLGNFLGDALILVEIHMIKGRNAREIGLGMAVVGFYSSVQFYKYYKGIDVIDIGIGSPQFVFAYALMLAGTALLIFFKPKQEYQELTEEKVDHLNGRIESQEQQVREALALRQEFIRNISHEYHAPMTGISSLADSLKHAYYHINDVKRLEAIDDILKSARRLEIFDSNISSLSALDKAGYKLNLQSLNLGYRGVGLALCKKVIESHGGTLKAESDGIKGAKFSFRLGK